MPEVALSGRQRHKQGRQLNSRLVIQDCHAMFMKSSDTKPIRYLSASGNNTETPFSGDSQIIMLRTPCRLVLWSIVICYHAMVLDRHQRSGGK